MLFDLPVLRCLTPLCEERVSGTLVRVPDTFQSLEPTLTNSRLDFAFGPVAGGETGLTNFRPPSVPCGSQVGSIAENVPCAAVPCKPRKNESNHSSFRAGREACLRISRAKANHTVKIQEQPRPNGRRRTNFFPSGLHANPRAEGSTHTPCAVTTFGGPFRRRRQRCDGTRG